MTEKPSLIPATEATLMTSQTAVDFHNENLTPEMRDVASVQAEREAREAATAAFAAMSMSNSETLSNREIEITPELFRLDPLVAAKLAGEMLKRVRQEDLDLAS